MSDIRSGAKASDSTHTVRRDTVREEKYAGIDSLAVARDTNEAKSAPVASPEKRTTCRTSKVSKDAVR